MTKKARIVTVGQASYLNGRPFMSYWHMEGYEGPGVWVHLDATIDEPTCGGWSFRELWVIANGGDGSDADRPLSVSSTARPGITVWIDHALPGEADQ